MKKRFICSVAISFSLLYLLFSCRVHKSSIEAMRNVGRGDFDTLFHPDSRYVVVFGDIQNYFASSYYMNYYSGSLDWISSHSDQIDFVMHTGDVTNNNTVEEWENFSMLTLPFSDVIPFYTCIGNHDYVCNATNIWNHRDSTRFSDYVGFPSTISHVVAYYDSLHFENVLVREELFDNDPVYLLILEMEPRRSVVRWADSLVRTIPDERIILITHRYMNASAKRYRNKAYMTDSQSTAPQYVWDSLIYQNDNIRCLLCGHVAPRSRLLYSTNSVGRIVPQIMFNIQNEPYGGNGLIELWEFNRGDDVFVRTFNTHTETFVNDSLTQFQFKFR